MVYGGMGGGPRGDHNIVIPVDDWTSKEGYIFKERKILGRKKSILQKKI